MPKIESTETIDVEANTSTTPAADTTTATKKSKRIEEFTKTSRAAKLSGMFHETSGKIKRKIGELKDDKELKDAGHKQEILGKVHRLVGSLRAIREGAMTKANVKRKETQAICIKHGGRILDVAGDFVEDLKNTLLK